MSKKTTTELLHILSSVRTPSELQQYTDALTKEHISCSFSECGKHREYQSKL